MIKPFHTLIPILAITLAACTAGGPHPSARNFPDATDTAKLAVPGDESRDGLPTLLAAAQPISGIEVSGITALPPGDVWEDLRRHFALPEQDNERIRVQRNWYARHPEYMARVTQRAQRYLWHIQQEVKKRGIPAEIALLPIVESAFDPFAYSHGRAAGLWQFIPATGKHYGLKQNWWYDGRRDLVDSTTAALDYLQRLNKRFKGDWLLALAAYNSGQGTVSKAQRNNRKKGRPVTFWDLKLPKETRAYVPKLLALQQLVRSPGEYGIQLDRIPDQPHFRTVDTGGQIDLAVAADLAGISLDALYRLNSGFNQWATDPAGPHRLLIPADQADQFESALAELPLENRVRWVRHKIKPGETLSHIAKRYKTTARALTTTNNLRGTSIRAGKYLMVPVSSKNKDHYKLSAEQRLSRTQGSSRKGYRTQHQVRSGDTFWDLSRHYKVGVRKLAAWNGMAPGDTLRVGQKLVVWTSGPNSNTTHPGAKARAIHYTVRKGDSLARISSRFSVSVTDLRKWNGLPKGRYLQPGQRLKLYVDPTRQADST